MSSINVSSSAGSAAGYQNPFQQIRSAFSQLSQSLASGNLSTAQSAYNTLQGLLPATQSSAGTGSNDGSSTGNGNNFQQQFSALGQALQSGNLAAAQQAFGALQPSQNGSGGVHHHHQHSRSGQASQQTSSSNTGNTAPGSVGSSQSPSSAETPNSTSASIDVSLSTVNITV